MELRQGDQDPRAISLVPFDISHEEAPTFGSTISDLGSLFQSCFFSSLLTALTDKPGYARIILLQSKFSMVFLEL
jgi:hypothetical protein